MEPIYAPRAMMEMDGIAECIQQDSPRAAIRFLDAVEKTCNLSLTFPELGAPLETE